MPWKLITQFGDMAQVHVYENLSEMIGDIHISCKRIRKEVDRGVIQPFSFLAEPVE